MKKDHHHHQPSEAAPAVSPGDLAPLKAQVGGHTSIRLLSDGAVVCKPLSYREYQFYRQLPAGLRGHVPRFAGVLATRKRSKRGSSVRFVSARLIVQNHVVNPL